MVQRAFGVHQASLRPNSRCADRVRLSAPVHPAIEPAGPTAEAGSVLPTVQTWLAGALSLRATGQAQGGSDSIIIRPAMSGGRPHASTGRRPGAGHPDRM